MNNRELAWATELKKTKHSATKHRTVPRELQKKQLEEELAYYKEKLRAARKPHSVSDTGPVLEKLISLRARQTALQVAALREMFGSIGPAMTKPIIQKYVRDCHRLIRAALPR